MTLIFDLLTSKLVCELHVNCVRPVISESLGLFVLDRQTGIRWTDKQPARQTDGRTDAVLNAAS